MLHRGAAPNGPESESKKPPPFVAFPFYEYEQFACMLVAFALNALDVFSGHRSHPFTGLMKTRPSMTQKKVSAYLPGYSSPEGTMPPSPAALVQCASETPFAEGQKA